MIERQTSKKRVGRIIGSLILIFLGSIFIAAFLPRRFNIRLIGSWSVQIRRPSLCESASGSICTMTFTAGGRKRNVDLTENCFNYPVLILASADSNAVYCLYDFDIDWQLIKLNLDQSFTPLPQNSPISGIVQHCECGVQRITRADDKEWKWAADEVENMSYHEFRQQCIGLAPVGVLSSRHSVAVTLRNCGWQGQYSGDVFVPAYMAGSRITNGPVIKP